MKVQIEIDADVHSIQAAVSICHVLHSFSDKNDDDDNLEIIKALKWFFVVLEGDLDMGWLATEVPKDARDLIHLMRKIADEMEEGLSRPEAK